ncbi:MAG: hypothetical protein WC860_10115, partial [Candidatus Margulisiibacteriota bacterium]
MNYATTFSENIIPQINKVLKFAMENPYSDFYRKKYADCLIKEIRSYEDLQKIPFLTKDEILAADIAERTFIPKEKVVRYRFSSGTTNSNKPLLLPRSAHVDIPHFKERAKENNLQNIFILMPSLSMPFLHANHLYGENVKAIHGDIKNLGLSAFILSALNIEGIHTTSTILMFFIDHLEKIHYDLNKIKWISLQGEYCSVQKYEYLKSKFCNAYFNFSYGSTETGERGYRCINLARSMPPHTFHLHKNFITEIIDENNKTLPLGSKGELVHTSLDTNAFPLIR